MAAKSTQISDCIYFSPNGPDSKKPLAHNINDESLNICISGVLSVSNLLVNFNDLARCFL